MPKERIGIMGGSFNPIHERHIEIAACAKREYKLNRVIFLPTGNPPHKHEELADVEDRFEMTRLAVSGQSDFTASRMEIDREGIIYTVDTLARLQKQMPDMAFDYIIGEDALMELPNWKKPDKLFSMCRFIVCRRTGEAESNEAFVHELEKRGARLAFLTLPAAQTSSTSIRRQIENGQTSDELPPQVEEYILQMGLYGSGKAMEGARERYAQLRRSLTDKRLTHSLLVANTARCLAQKHGLDPEQAALAGLLHDCAKCLPLATMQRIARENRLLLDKETLQSGNLLHGPVGAVVAEKEYGIIPSSYHLRRRPSEQGNCRGIRTLGYPDAPGLWHYRMCPADLCEPQPQRGQRECWQRAGYGHGEDRRTQRGRRGGDLGQGSQHYAGLL